MTDLRQPPTVSIRRVDMSPPRPHASASAVVPSRTTEANLFDAYAIAAPVVVRRPCACGGWIVAERGLVEDWIGEAIRNHSETPMHWAWRDRVGIV